MYNLGRYPGRDLPEVHAHPGIIDRILEISAATLLILIWVAFMYVHQHIPEGETRGPLVIGAAMGSVGMLLVAWASYISIRFISFPFRVTERTVVIQYLLATRFARVLNIFVGLIVLLGVLSDSYILSGVEEDFSDMLMGVGAVLLALSFGGYYYLAYKYR